MKNGVDVCVYYKGFPRRGKYKNIPRLLRLKWRAFVMERAYPKKTRGK